MALKLVVRQKLLGQDLINVFHYAGPDATMANAQVVGQLIRTVYLSQFQDRFSAEYLFYSILAYDTEAPSGTPGVELLTAPDSWNGTNPNPPQISQVAMNVAWVAQSGPPFRGRVYIGGFAQFSTGTDGEWSSTDQLRGNIFADGIREIPVELGLNMDFVLVRPVSATNPVELNAIVTGGVVKPTPSTLNRRKVGRGS